MRIWTSITIDRNDRVVDGDFIILPDSTPVAAAKGGGSSTTVVSYPGPSPEELELTRIQTDLAREQLTLMRQQTSDQDASFKMLMQSLERMNLELSKEPQIDPVAKEIQQLELDWLRRGGAPSEQEKQEISSAISSARTTGEQSILAFQEEALKQARDIMAPARGLRTTDEPIVAKTTELTREAQRQQAQLTTALAQSEAEARLNYPLARAQVSSSIGEFQQQLAEASRQFRLETLQQGFENQLRLQAMRQEGALGLLGVQPAGASALAGLQNMRSRQSTTTTTSKTPFNWMGALSAVGSLAQGIGALKMSDARLKENITPIDSLRATESIINLKPVIYAWRTEPERREAGFIAQEVAESAPLAYIKNHANGFDAVDYGALLAITIAALQDLQRRVGELEWQRAK